MPSSTFAPSSKPLSGRYLAFAEREEIALALAQDFGVREIARRLDVSHNLIPQRFGSKEDLWYAAVDHGLGRAHQIRLGQRLAEDRKSTRLNSSHT